MFNTSFEELGFLDDLNEQELRNGTRERERRRGEEVP
jgi:hypothetical protein